MKGKMIRRILFIVAVLVLILAPIGAKLGLFDSLFNKNLDGKLQEDLDHSSGNLSDGVDGASGATVSEQKKEGQDNKNAVSKPEPIEKEHSTVSIVRSSRQKAEELTSEDIRSMVREAVRLAGGLDTLVQDNQTVVLKPNLVQKHVDSTGELFEKELNAITTDWRVTKAVVELVREKNPHGKVYVMEGSAGDKTRDTMNYLNYTHDHIPGVDAFLAIEEDSGGWQDFNAPGLVKHALPKGLLHKEYYLNKKYYEADVLISIPALKTNSGAVVTGGIKNVSVGATPANVYGVSPDNPGRTKMVSHKIVDGELDKWIYDYYMCRPVDFVVMDGLVGFQNGPVPIGKKNIQGDKMNMRLVMAGRDAIAVDTIEALVTGWDPLSIPYLGYLNKSAMGNLDTSRITVAGNQVDTVRKDFAIRFQKLGGVKVTDQTPPALTIKNQTVNKDKLEFLLEFDAEATKLEIYVDGQLYKVFPAEEAQKVTVDTASLPKGRHSIKLWVFDRYLNRAEQLIEWTK